VVAPDGQRRLDGTLSGPLGDAEALGERLARQLLDRGAASLILAARQISTGESPP
jgi:porphobilinogen deaminase